MVETSPHLEAFKAAGYEVLYLVEPVDELVVQSLAEFDGIRLKSVGKGRIKLGSEQEKERAEQELKEQEAGCAELLTFLQNKLDRHIKQVRLSNRLTTSPACLVGEEHDYSPQLECLLQKGKGGGPKQRRVLELNPKHQILLKMQQRFQRNKEEPVLSNYAELLLGYAHLAEGSELPDPVQFNYAVTELMATTL